MHPTISTQSMITTFIAISCTVLASSSVALGQRRHIGNRIPVSLYASTTSGALDFFWDSKGQSNLEFQLKLLRFNVAHFTGQPGADSIQQSTRAFIIPPLTGDALYSDAEDVKALHSFVNAGGLVIVHESIRRPEATQELIAQILGYRGDWHHCKAVTDNSRSSIGQGTVSKLAGNFLDVAWPQQLEDAAVIQVHSWCKHEDPAAVSYPLYTLGGDSMKTVAQAFTRVGSRGAVLWLGYAWQSGPKEGWGELLHAAISAFDRGVFSAPSDAVLMEQYPLRLDSVLEDTDALAVDTVDIVRRFLTGNLVATVRYGGGGYGYNYGYYPPPYGNAPTYAPPRAPPTPPRPQPSPTSPPHQPQPASPPLPQPTDPAPQPSPSAPSPTSPSPQPSPTEPSPVAPSPTSPSPQPNPDAPSPQPLSPPSPRPLLPPSSPLPPLPPAARRFLWFRNMTAHGVQGANRPVVWYDDADFSTQLHLHYNNSRLWLVDRQPYPQCNLNPPCRACRRAWYPYNGSNAPGFPSGSVVLYFREPVILKRVLITELLQSKAVAEVFLLPWPAVPVPELGLNITPLTYASVNQSSDVFRDLRRRALSACATQVQADVKPPSQRVDDPQRVPPALGPWNQTRLPEFFASRAVGGVGIVLRGPSDKNQRAAQIAGVRFVGRVLYPRNTEEYGPYLSQRRRAPPASQ